MIDGAVGGGSGTGAALRIERPLTLLSCGQDGSFDRLEHCVGSDRIIEVRAGV
jgi:hypothetical protein